MNTTEPDEFQLTMGLDPNLIESERNLPGKRRTARVERHISHDLRQSRRLENL